MSEVADIHRIVALSGGKDSTAMALRLAEIEPNNYEFCITPTGRELPVMNEHWRTLECLLGAPLIRIPGPSMLDLICKYRALPNFRMRWCTREIKIEPFLVYAADKAPAVCVVGIRADEVHDRSGADSSDINGVEQDFPLVRWGWGISDVRNYLTKRGVTIPRRTDCDMCFYQHIGEWWLLWRDHKDRWEEVVALEMWTGHTLRTEGKDSWAVSIQDLGRQFESGLVPKDAAQEKFSLDVASRPTMCAWCAR